MHVAADQGVEFYTKWATDTIAAYKDRTDLKESEIEDLAKAITIQSVNAGSLQEQTLRAKYKISIQLLPNGQSTTKLVNSNKSFTFKYTAFTSNPLTCFQDIYTANYVTITKQ